MTSQVRQNYHEECEACINKQINRDLHCSYIYQAMAFHFDRDSVALPGFHKFFKKRSDEDRAQAEKLMKYQNTRGGRIVLQDIKQPEITEWVSGVEAMKHALQVEKCSNGNLLALHSTAESHGDSQLCDFLEGEFLEQKVEIIKEIGDHISQLLRVGPGLGEYTYDKESLQD